MKNLLRLTALVLSITACPPYGNSQNRPLPIYVPSQNYTVNDGLPSNHVYGIVQDSTGFIWIGTDNGLSRFDGHSFRNYLHAGSNPASLSSNNIRRLAIDRRQRLWLSLDNGVEIYDPGTETFEHFDLKTPDSVAVEGQTIEIIEDSDGEIWISTVNSGVFRYSPESQHLTVYRHNPQDENSLSQDYVSTLYQSNDGTIWMGTYSEGLCAFSKTDSRFTRYTKEQGLSSNSIDAITEDSYGNLWLGTVTSGLDCFDRTTGRFTNYDASRFDGRLMRIHALSETSPGELLVCTENGASRFRISEQGLHPADASEAGFTRTGYISIYSALQDREGNLWFGSLNNGVMFYPAHNDFTCYMLRGEEPANSGHVVNTICPVGDGSYLLGTPDNRILRFDERSGSLSLYRESRHPGSTGHDIYAMLIDEGTLWIAAFQYGIEAVDLRSGRSRFYLNNPAEPSSRVFRLFRSSNGRINIGRRHVGGIHANAVSMLDAVNLRQTLHVLPTQVLLIGRKTTARSNIMQLASPAHANRAMIGIAVHNVHHADVLEIHLQQRRVSALPKRRGNDDLIRLSKLMSQVKHGVIIVPRVTQFIATRQRLRRQRKKPQVLKN